MEKKVKKPQDGNGEAADAHPTELLWRLDLPLPAREG
jgi:hypothetical protein